MIRFLFKGLLRDRSRSLLPILVVTAGVTLTVFAFCYVNGILGDMIEFSAKYTSGHVKIMTRAYAENKDQVPNDLALLEVNDLISNLHDDYPKMEFVQRISFGGLLDAPDENGETKKQGVVVGMAADLISENTKEIERLNLDGALRKGRFPEKSNEVLLSDEFATKLEVSPGDKVTLITSTMYGGMSIQNFVIAGTIEFGVQFMDRSGMIADISGIQNAMDMNDACGELLGFLEMANYDDIAALNVETTFNEKYTDPNDEFSPVMTRLKNDSIMAGYFEYMDGAVGILISIFILAMSIVLWNTGLIGGLRRYGEIGVRLAIGEEKGHIYRSMILESIFVGIIGSFLGTIIGLGFSFWVQEVGINIGEIMKNSKMMVPSVFRAHITPTAYYLGFIPGLFSVVLGTMLSGIGIYKRKTASLFKELET
ncbi:MAG: FtsX-like permease family protein [Bacteroidales bacterium]|nr:FtsX-like permease family protein [Bacteroidales bacterium]